VGAGRRAGYRLSGVPGPDHHRERPRGRHLLHDEVPPIGDVEVARPVHRHSGGCTEVRPGRRPGFRRAEAPGPGHHRERPRGRHLLHHVVEVVRDEQVAGSVHGHPTGIAEVRAGRRTGCGSSVGSGPGHHRERPRGRHLLHHVVEVVRDVEVARGVHRHPTGVVEVRCGRGTGCGRAVGSGPGHHRERPQGRHLLHHVVEVVRDVEVAGGVHGHPLGIGEVRADRRTGCRCSKPSGPGDDAEIAGLGGAHGARAAPCNPRGAQRHRGQQDHGRGRYGERSGQRTRPRGRGA
jgi:hypothetical protein